MILNRLGRGLATPT